MTQNCDQPAAEHPLAGGGNMPKISATRGESSVRAASIKLILPRFFDEPVQTPRRHILLDLPVPFVGVELGKPSAEDGQFVCRQFANTVLKLLNHIHSRSLSRISIRSNGLLGNDHCPGSEEDTKGLPECAAD